jgi:hypothetical protein
LIFYDDSEQTTLRTCYKRIGGPKFGRIRRGCLMSNAPGALKMLSLLSVDLLTVGMLLLLTGWTYDTPSSEEEPCPASSVETF